MENLITTAGRAWKNTAACEARARIRQRGPEAARPTSAPAYARQLTSGTRKTVRQTGEEGRTTA